MVFTLTNTIGKYAKNRGGVTPRWVAGGSGGNIFTTSINNGGTWNGVTTGYGGLTSVNSIAYGKDGSGKSLLVAVGEGTNKIATSSDGITWEGKTANAFRVTGLDNGGRGVAYGNGKWIAVGNGSSGENTISISTDGGNTWAGSKIQTTTGMSSLSSIAYGNGRWVIGGFYGGNGNTMATSIDDGVTWSGINGDIQGGTGLNTEVTCVAYGNGRWGAVGNSTRYFAYLPENGTAWVPVQQVGSIIVNLSCIAYGNGRWVVGSKNPNGGNFTAYASETNLTSWTSGGAISGMTLVKGLAYANGLWIAAGSGGIATSSNGVGFSKVTANGLTSQGLCAAFIN
jgi:hypothetical protein